MSSETLDSVQLSKLSFLLWPHVMHCKSAALQLNIPDSFTAYVVVNTEMNFLMVTETRKSQVEVNRSVLGERNLFLALQTAAFHASSGDYSFSTDLS